MSDSQTKFSDKQIEAWRAYERVRQSDVYNMFDPRARVATRLSPEDYAFCMNHFTALKEAARAASPIAAAKRGRKG